MFGLDGTLQQWAFWLGVGVSLYTFVDYHISIVRKQTQPYILTWMSLGVLTTLSACLQFAGGASLGAGLTLLAGANNFFIAIQSWRYGSKVFVKKGGGAYTGWRDFVRANWRDLGCLVVAASCTVIWLGAGHPVIAVAGLSVASLAAIAMTFMKAWYLPYSEPIRKYVLSTVRYVLATLAVAKYSFVSGFYPTMWIGVNAAMVLLLGVRRHQLASAAQAPREVVVHLDGVVGVDSIFALRCCDASFLDLSSDERRAVTRDARLVTCPVWGLEQLMDELAVYPPRVLAWR